MQLRNWKNNEKGIVLIGMVFMMVLTAALALGMNRKAGMHTRMTSNRARSIQVYFGQLAAMAEARWQLSRDSGWRIGASPVDYVYNGITYKRTVLDCAITGYEDAVTVSVTAPGGNNSVKAHLRYELTDRSTGAYYILDTFNHRIRRVDNQTGIITTVAGTGSAGFSGDGGPADSAKLNYPRFICGDTSGNIYIADDHNHRIRKIDGDTGDITTVAGSGTQGYNGDDIAATSANLNYPNAVWVDGLGNIYIGDEQNHRIRKVDGETGIITTVAGTGTAGYSGDGAAATSAKLFLQRDVGVWADDDGNIYIADNGNHCIRKVDGGTGDITTVAGTGSAGYSGDGAAATSAELNYPNGVWVDDDGNIFIADQSNHCIRRVDESTGDISTIAGTGTAGYSGDGGPSPNAQLNAPHIAWTDAGGDLYIADTGNNRIRKVDSQTGIITTIAGTGTAGYGGDLGPALSAQFNDPRSVHMQVKGGSAQWGWSTLRELY
ncbi:SMP-30/gluconolactonase/LRE family protein [Thermodesulfobacteriota bacterium]